MKLLGLAVLAVTLTNYTCQSPEVMKARQETVDLCQARGGIPILNNAGDNIVNCAFPPVSGGPLTVERVKP